MTGWVRNTDSSSVEGVAQAGEERVLDDFFGHVKLGPQGASVEKIEKKNDTSNEQFAHFTIR